MPDWRELVRQRLGRLSLDARREDEIVAELANHLDDVFEDSAGREVTAEETVSCALEHVSDWKELRREIMRAETEEASMNYRTKSVWLPGLLTLTLSMGLFWFLDRAGLHPRIVWMNNPPLLCSLPWLLALPAFGAGGAYGSRRGGGGNTEQLLAAVFPAAAMAILFLAVLPVALVVDSHVPLVDIFSGLASGMLGWVVIPGVALVAGALAILATHRRTPSRQHA